MMATAPLVMGICRMGPCAASALDCLVSGHDAVAGAEVNGAGGNLVDAGAGTNRLIVYFTPVSL